MTQSSQPKLIKADNGYGGQRWEYKHHIIDCYGEINEYQNIACADSDDDEWICADGFPSWPVAIKKICDHMDWHRNDPEYTIDQMQAI